MLRRCPIHVLVLSVALALDASAARGALVAGADGDPARLDVRPAGRSGVRFTLKPLGVTEEVLASPALVDRSYPAPAFSVESIDEPIRRRLGDLFVDLSSEPLQIVVSRAQGDIVQKITLDPDGRVRFVLDEQPLLGLGEGGPEPGRDWRQANIEFDRRGRQYAMRPRWQSNAYGSRNPVGLLIGTAGWALWVATPWGEFDLRNPREGTFVPWTPPDRPENEDSESQRRQMRLYLAQTQGRPPVVSRVPGMLDIFVFDAQEPTNLMRDLSTMTGPAVLPPKWALGYMQSHRTLEDEDQLLRIVKTFREKRIPLDAVIYLGTGFCPRGWNKSQPSFEFNPDVFHREPAAVLDDLHAMHVNVVLHIVPWSRDRLPSLQGSIPPVPGEPMDSSHISNYWSQHEPLVRAGVDAWWPDEGDWFNLHERMKRHQLYYEGPLSARPGVRPWSLHRNGYLGVARWGGWIWSGDTESSWKTLEGQIAVGLNHSLSLSPYWGSDIGGFYPSEELTGELYARWFQFASFCPSFRSHGRTWWTRLPWGWGLDEMGPLENRRNPLPDELNNPSIEPICRQYAQLRSRLMPYHYTLAWQARTTGMPFMRSLWLHYPKDAQARSMGDQYLWGRDLLVAPVYAKGARVREVYLPRGAWYDWWTHSMVSGGRTISREVDLATMPIYVRAGAILPLDPVRQYAGEQVDEPTTVQVFQGADGQFTLYDDDGQSLAYLRGHSALTRMTWEDQARRLVLEPGRDLSDFSPSRRFRIELVPERKVQMVLYVNRRMVVTF